MLVTKKVAYVNPPKQQGWSASIKTSEGEFISIKPEEMASFRQGETYTMEIVENVKNGKIYKNFVKFAQAAGGPQQIVHTLPQAPGTVYVENPAPTSAAANVEKHYAPTQAHDAQAKHIWCTGIVGRAMGSGRFDYSDILPLADAAAEAYDKLFGGT